MAFIARGLHSRGTAEEPLFWDTQGSGSLDPHWFRASESAPLTDLCDPRDGKQPETAADDACLTGLVIPT